MVDNRIRVMLAEKKMSAAALAARIPDMSKPVMSYIVQGITLPTRDDMDIICRELDCKATDLYEAKELDLNVTGNQTADSQQNKTAGKTIPLAQDAPMRIRIERDSKDHAGYERIHFWFTPEEKAALIKAVKGLGYRNTTEWMREMYRQTLKQYAALNLDGKMLHDLVPPYIDPFVPATDKS